MESKKEWRESKEILELSEMLKAMAHPSRIAIIHLLSRKGAGKLTVKYMYSKLKLSQPVISRHLGILKNIGLVQRTTEGLNTFYELNETNSRVKQISECFSSLKLPD